VERGGNDDPVVIPNMVTIAALRPGNRLQACTEPPPVGQAISKPFRRFVDFCSSWSIWQIGITQQFEENLTYAVHVALFYGVEPTSPPPPEAMHEPGLITNPVKDDRVDGSGRKVLHPVATATTVRVRDGKAMTDGLIRRKPKKSWAGSTSTVRILDAASLKWQPKLPAGASMGRFGRPVVDFSPDGLKRGSNHPADC